MKNFAVVEQHHEVLPFWAASPAMEVVSLDFHTDTLPAFLRFIQKGGTPPEFSANPEKVAENLKYLRHDEHFDYALKSGIVNSITLISHFDFTASVPEGLTIYVPDEVRNLQEQDVNLLDEEFFRRADKMLESEFLSTKLQAIPDKPYILDIDLDYFVTRRSLHPERPEFFAGLMQHAEFITFSMEREWVKILSRPEDRMNSEYILQQLMNMIA